MTDDSFYLGNYLKGLTGLPNDVRKNFSNMLNLDERNHDLTTEIDSASQEYLRKVKERHLNPRKRKSEMEKIMKMFHEAKDNSDSKVNIAIQTYELVDKHIRKLDADLAKFESEMKETGGRLSQTESEDDEKVTEKKMTKKKKKTLTKDDETKKPVTAVAAATIANGVAAVGDIPIVDMPVDPNEPTYCLCQQVSYGEMIGCDNQDCPIEWFHFPCMALTVKPKGKWYCPKCLPMFKKQK
eukprot:TRINITY_DN43353_c0_g1_i1.p1 TRINITY_DN43353_c0_g1~~TRINITY_DN43353_c0_g1_i1.p1  ORF type:complete len:251 (-),score=85.81 TRINITY_DN43353_c0_g1_i1:414-1133(-)